MRTIRVIEHISLAFLLCRSNADKPARLLGLLELHIRKIS